MSRDVDGPLAADLDVAAPEQPCGSAVVAGRYVLGPVIGIGSSAVVHRARDLHDDGPVAFKRFRDGGSPVQRRQQERELAVLSEITEHPGLVRLRDAGDGSERTGGPAGRDDGSPRPWVVTDLVPGPTLAERIKTGPPSGPHAIRRMGAQLAAALAHVHAAGFVHRDVKPANVLLGFHGTPRLADFGIAVPIDATLGTEEGCVIGTAAYLAPEQVRGQRVGPSADVYALGLVLLEALTGRREYPGGAVESATARLHRAPVVPDDLPGGLGAILVAMTAAHPADRPTAVEVAAALAADPVTSVGPAGRHRLASGPDRRGRILRLAAAGLVAAAFAGGVVVLLSPGGAPPADAVQEFDGSRSAGR